MSAPTAIHTRGGRHDVAQPVAVQQAGTLIGTEDTINFSGGAVVTSSGGVLAVRVIVTTTAALKAYPTQAAPITLTSTTTAYLAGSWVEVVPASTITNTFYLANVTISNVSNINSRYLIQIGTGAGGAEAVKFEAEMGGDVAGLSSGETFVLPLPLEIAANTRVAARVATSGSTARTVDVRIGYLEGTL